MLAIVACPRPARVGQRRSTEGACTGSAVPAETETKAHSICVIQVEEMRGSGQARPRKVLEVLLSSTFGPLEAAFLERLKALSPEEARSIHHRYVALASSVTGTDANGDLEAADAMATHEVEYSTEASPSAVTR